MKVLWIPPADPRNITDRCRCGAKLPATIIIDADVSCHECAKAKLGENG
jgi:hypothetical protein